MQAPYKVIEKELLLKHPNKRNATAGILRLQLSRKPFEGVGQVDESDPQARAKGQIDPMDLIANDEDDDGERDGRLHIVITDVKGLPAGKSPNLEKTGFLLKAKALPLSKKKERITPAVYEFEKNASGTFDHSFTGSAPHKNLAHFVFPYSNDVEGDGQSSGSNEDGGINFQVMLPGDYLRSDKPFLGGTISKRDISELINGNVLKTASQDKRRILPPQAVSISVEAEGINSAASIRATMQYISASEGNLKLMPRSLKISSSSLKILSPSLKIEVVKMNGKDGKRLKIGPKSTGIPKGQGGKFSWKKGDEQHFIKYQNLNQKVPHFLKVTLQKKSKAAVGHCFKSMAEIFAYDGETELHFDMKNKNGNIIATTSCRCPLDN